jgi:hypothetical protein
LGSKKGSEGMPDSAYSHIKTQKDKSARVLLEIPVDRDFIIYAATRTFFLPIAPGDFIFDFQGETDGRGE